MNAFLTPHDGPVTITLACRQCAAPIVWDGTRRRPIYCKDDACIAARAVVRSRRYWLERRSKAAVIAGTYRAPNQPPAPVVVVPGESAESVDAKLARAKAARLARERAAGKRTYTIESGWIQRADYTPFGRDGGEEGW